nr:DUF924 family protein [Alteraurantiacibacter aestuarii]
MWFHQLDPQDWWGGSDKATAILRNGFERWLTALQNRPDHEFLSDPHTALAAVLLFDQLPRNLYSGSAKAFAFDAKARALTRAVLARGWDSGLTPAQRQFLALPLMHSEQMADQLLAVRYYTQLGPRFGMQFARDHHAIIARFGRFPHRNEALGRTSTAAEIRAVKAGFAW